MARNGFLQAANGSALRGRVVVITGASSGVGRASARAFADHGAAVALLARGRDALEGARQEVESRGARALSIPTDVADADAVEAAAQEAERELGPIDVWVNNAMTSVFAPVHEITAEEFRRVTEVTYLGFVYGTLSALRRMRERDRGVIVQVGSALAYRGIPLQSAYCACKHAIQGFTESLRCELFHSGSSVRVTMVQMPALNTPQFDTVRTRLPRHPQPVPPRAPRRRRCPRVPRLRRATALPYPLTPRPTPARRSGPAASPFAAEHGPPEQRRARDRRAGERAPVASELPLRACRMRLAVEVAVRAAVAGHGREEIVRALGWDAFIRLLRVEARPREIAVADPG